MIATAKFLSRALIATAFVSLAGCAGDNNSADLAPAAPQQAEPAPAAPATAQRSTAQRSSPAGRNTQGAAPPAAPAPAREENVVMTPEKIKADCWMRYEGDKKIKNLDQRAALVDKCIEETSRGQPPQRN